MFLHLSVILFTGEVSGRHHPCKQTLPSGRPPPCRHSPRQTPLDRHPPIKHTPPVDTEPPWADTPQDRHPPDRHLPGRHPQVGRHRQAGRHLDRQIPLARQTPLPGTATAVDGTHPTGMLSCSMNWLTLNDPAKNQQTNATSSEKRTWDILCSVRCQFSHVASDS